MKIIEYVLSIAFVLAGFSGLIAVVEELYMLTCYLILLTVMLEVLRKLLIRYPGKFLSYFTLGGGLFWYTGVVSILLWKLFYSEFGMPGMGAVLVFILAGLTWFSKNILRGKEDKRYAGLPLSAGAGLVISLIAVCLDLNKDCAGLAKPITVLVILISYLMVTGVKFLSMADIKFTKKIIPVTVISGIIVVFGLAYWKLYALVALFSVYALTGLYKEVRKNG